MEARAIREDHVGQTIAGDVAGYGSRRARVLVREAIRLANDVAVARLVDPGESQRVRISSAGAAFPVLGVDVGFAGSEPDAGLVATAANVGLAVPSASDAMAIPESVRESVFTSALS